MERFIAIDSGKFATKVAEYRKDEKKEKKVRTFQIRTKISDGDFIDDAIEKNTVIVEIDGHVYKVGNGARGEGANLDTDKNDDIHRICTLTALASVASSDEKDVFNVAVGLPAKDWAIPAKREEYKKAMLPEGDITITIRPNSKVEPITKTFTIKNRFALAESIGALFMDGIIEDVTTNPNIPTGVLDIGNLNLNATFWQGTELVYDKSSTQELGGAILIQELAQELSANIDYVDEIIAANILKADPEERHLPMGLGLTEEEVQLSAEVTKKILRNHAEKIRRSCKQRNWSLKATRIVAIGGTSADIKNELKEVFGNVKVLPNSTFCNALGYLRIMCSKLDSVNDIIELPSLDEDKKTKIIEKKDENENSQSTSNAKAS